jgi:FMN phosphatase YigB (HAD superfamily)
MKKTTVFLDWVNTIVKMEPDRQALCVEALREAGIAMDPRDALRGILLAEEQVPQGRPVQWDEGRSPSDFVRYNDIIMRTAGLEPLDEPTTMRLVRRVREMARGIRFVLFPDVMPALQELKASKFTTGVLSNMNRPLQPVLEALGLSPYLDLSITSSEVGGPGKPEPPIFLEALRRAGARPEQAVHVGDEPWVDGAGALNVGITPIIIDRWGLSGGESSYVRITSLVELPDLITSLA